MDLKKELWDKLTQLEEKKKGKADVYYDILSLFNVIKNEVAVCDCISRVGSFFECNVRKCKSCKKKIK